MSREGQVIRRYTEVGSLFIHSPDLYAADNSWKSGMPSATPSGGGDQASSRLSSLFRSRVVPQPPLCTNGRNPRTPPCDDVDAVGRSTGMQMRAVRKTLVKRHNKSARSERRRKEAAEAAGEATASAASRRLLLLLLLRGAVVLDHRRRAVVRVVGVGVEERLGGVALRVGAPYFLQVTFLQARRRAKLRDSSHPFDLTPPTLKCVADH